MASQSTQGIELSEMLDEKKWRSWFHRYLAYLLLKSGDLEKALGECNKSLNNAVESELLGEQRWTLHLKGLIQMEMNSLTEAQISADELKKLIESGMNKKAIRHYHHLLGRIEFEKNNYSEAVKNFEMALSLLPSQHSDDELPSQSHALFMNSLAATYFEIGDFDKAQAEYEKIISLTSGRLYYGDIFVKSFYMLGKIFQSKGEIKQARENYQKFMDLWSQADPKTPEMIDAREQLASLVDQ